jgi:hypothetical protein
MGGQQTNYQGGSKTHAGMLKAPMASSNRMAALAGVPVLTKRASRNAQELLDWRRRIDALTDPANHLAPRLSDPGNHKAASDQTARQNDLTEQRRRNRPNLGVTPDF